MAYRILTTTSSFGKVSNEPLEMLRQAGLEVVINPYGRTLKIEESIEILPGFDGLIAGTEKLNEEVFTACPDLRYLCRLGAGMDSVDFKAAEKHNVVVENTPSAHVDGVAELTLGGILSSLRRIGPSHANLTKGVWKKPMGGLLTGKTVGIIGLGQVGKRLVELLSPFHVKVLAFDLYEDLEFASNNRVEYTSVDNVALLSDIISIHTPYTDSSRYLIGSDFLSKVKSSVMIVNASRGGLVDEEALVGFLKSNSGASAYLDTFEKEPYQGPLCDLENCTLTPHIGSYASEVRIQMEIEAAQKVINFFSK